ncbi:2-phospho-L-lactate guanylyltransferase [Haloarcula hispanica N601]|uniref:2-phospho-L-lactate guanylyltransferase n=3 Tax=Haloarcula hispanica TaxID=51589 RepID=A0A482TA87_HALHI|nr:MULTISPECIES: 2-phospho-L-lactate guanylyltransferase [Haloarcula]AEM56146.1 putative phospholactate guanylyltransferase [Haloarcula hispanica ATCC 33960]AHB64958.1 2-phospho-L-lactate guanylyltransferase [Haloarcula hispanica N601]AJF26123.1 2-phospho-L-lactate guanylyltransferase [Haloarcula sp. CBA1115]KAA9408065.1 2-phospho-L-lactate guanylyltransferase [Haloarcula sp. CBA1131]KAA9408885.1 2-phospho-L-lactate guanylyltransferase [Haloarcula hispanica]
MRLVVPVSGSDPKTRLASVLSPDERRDFTEAMLADVVDAVTAAGHEPDVISTAPLDCAAPLTVDDRGLDPLVNDLLASIVTDGDGALAVVMADLPLVTPKSIERLLAPDADVVLAPGLGGGTNAFVCRHPEFRVDYHGASIRDHRQIARDVGASVTEVDSRRLATDIDEPGDLAEVLLHSDGAAADWLIDAGFSLSLTDGRVTVSRE